MNQESDEILHSWKEIAQWLKCDVRTAMRWEQQRALPVRSPPGKKRGPVFAYRWELDAWQRHEDSAQVRPVEPTEASSRRMPILALKMTAVAVLLAVVLALGIYAVGIRFTGQSRVERASFSGSRLQAWNSKERLLWEHDFGEPLNTPSAIHLARRIQFIDLDGDGQDEILAGPSFLQQDFIRDELFCFSSQGNLLWKYSPNQVLKFAGKEFRGPWHFNDLLALSSGKSKVLWLAVSHHTWFPTSIVKIDAAGHPALQYVSSGTIWRLANLRTAEGSYVLAGGNNNEYGAGALTILREDQAPASSPQTAGSSYQCDDCPRGEPFRLIVFPRTEINRMLGAAFNRVLLIGITGNEIQVQTEETRGALHGSFGFYELSPDLQFRSFSLGVGYWELHKLLEQEGKVRHGAERCPDRIAPKVVRIWEPEIGWQETSVPSVLPSP